MRVVLQHNLDPSAGLVNGTQGTILGFKPYDGSKLLQKGNHGDDAGAPAVSGAHARYRQEEIKQYGEENNEQPWPVVEFDNGMIKTVYAECAVD